ARCAGDQQAINALLVRFYLWIRCRMSYWGKSSAATVPLDDLHHEGVFALIRAIARFDLSQISMAGGCSFRTFLKRVLWGHFRDCSKRRWRVERHIDRSVDVAQCNVGA